jgi:hypothetical protein
MPAAGGGFDRKTPPAFRLEGQEQKAKKCQFYVLTGRVMFSIIALACSTKAYMAA